jgi:hypothetical protein
MCATGDLIAYDKRFVVIIIIIQEFYELNVWPRVISVSITTIKIKKSAFCTHVCTTDAVLKNKTADVYVFSGQTDGQIAFIRVFRSLTVNYYFPMFCISVRSSSIEPSDTPTVKHTAKCDRFVHTVFMCFVWFSQQTVITYKWMLQSVITTL